MPSPWEKQYSLMQALGAGFYDGMGLRCGRRCGVSFGDQGAPVLLHLSRRPPGVRLERREG